MKKDYLLYAELLNGIAKMDGQWAVGSNAQRYQDFVWQAVTTSSGFGAFRRHPHYTPILEHVSQDQGRQFFELVTDPLIREICLESEYADTVGSPVVYEFDGRKISPSTLRYGKVLQELVDIFPDLHNMHNIIEIGVGYGGQARLVSEYVRRKSGKVRNYYLVDLLPVLNLSRLYLEHFPITFEVKYLTRSEISPVSSYDLVISNYAFSEFTRSLQRQYLDLILLRSRNGYLTMNTGLQDTLPLASPEGAHCHSAAELLSILPNSVVIDDCPKFGRYNYILAFGQQKVSNPLSLEILREQLRA